MAEIAQLQGAVLTSREVQAFEDADVNDDGSLARTEYVDYKHPEQSRRVRQRFVARFLREHDANHDGVCSMVS